MDLIVPVVNMNGNSLESLVDELKEARGKVQAAQNAVTACDWSHGRNFQTHPNGQSAARIAQQQHRDMVSKLNEISTELLHLAMAILEQRREMR